MHQAIKRSKEYIESGNKWIVDIDLAKYFDTINHDKLMRLLSIKIEDGRVLSLIRKYLQSGVMINGVVMETEEGTPQGGNLSPLLGNIMLDELDKELEKRGLKYCRYADDCNIYVGSKKAAERVMESIIKFIDLKLKLKVNRKKSKVGRPWGVKFLGFAFYYKPKGIGMRVHPRVVKRFKEKLKKLTGRSNSISMEERAKKISQAIVGWVNYFGLADMRSLAVKLDEWLRRRIRMCYWKQWKKIKTKHDNLYDGGYDGHGDKNVPYDGITINTDNIVYYKNGKIIDTQKIVYKVGKSIRTGKDIDLLHIGGEGSMPCEVVIDGNKMTLYDNVYDGYQYDFKKATSKE